MFLLFLGEQYEVDKLITEQTESPEDILLRLEEALENGELTIEDACNFLKDYSSRSTKH